MLRRVKMYCQQARFVAFMFMLLHVVTCFVSHQCVPNFTAVVVNIMQAEKEHPSWRWIMIKLYSLPQFAACNIRGESLHSGLSELKECGLTLRVLHQAEISWGTYSDSSWIQMQTGQNCRQHICRWKGIWGGGVLDKGYTFHVVEQVDLQSGLLIGIYDRCIIYVLSLTITVYSKITIWETNLIFQGTLFIFHSKKNNYDIMTQICCCFASKNGAESKVQKGDQQIPRSPYDRKVQHLDGTGQIPTPDLPPEIAGRPESGAVFFFPSFSHVVSGRVLNPYCQGGGRRWEVGNHGPEVWESIAMLISTTWWSRLRWSSLDPWCLEISWVGRCVYTYHDIVNLSI